MKTGAGAAGAEHSPGSIRVDPRAVLSRTNSFTLAPFSLAVPTGACVGPVVAASYGASLRMAAAISRLKRSAARLLAATSASMVGSAIFSSITE